MSVHVITEPCVGVKDAACVAVCPVDCIHPRKDEPEHSRALQLYIDPDTCIGCGLCARNCPYGNINLHPFEVIAEDPERAGRKKAVIKQKATSCDLCTHLKEPSCVYACPHDAAHRVDPKKFFAEIVEAGQVGS